MQTHAKKTTRSQLGVLMRSVVGKSEVRMFEPWQCDGVKSGGEVPAWRGRLGKNRAFIACLHLCQIFTWKIESRGSPTKKSWKFLRNNKTNKKFTLQQTQNMSFPPLSRCLFLGMQWQKSLNNWTLEYNPIVRDAALRQTEERRHHSILSIHKLAEQPHECTPRVAKKTVCSKRKENVFLHFKKTNRFFLQIFNLLVTSHGTTSLLCSRNFCQNFCVGDIKNGNLNIRDKKCLKIFSFAFELS